MNISQYLIFKSKKFIFGLILIISLISTSSFAALIPLGTENSSGVKMTVYYDDVNDRVGCIFNTGTYQCGLDIWNRASTISLDGSQVDFKGSSLNAGDVTRQYTLVQNAVPGKEYSVKLEIKNSGYGTCGTRFDVVFDKTIKVKVSGLSVVSSQLSTVSNASTLQVSWTPGIIKATQYTVVLEGKSIADPSLGFQEMEIQKVSSNATSTVFVDLYPGITYKTTVYQDIASSANRIDLSDEISPALTSASQLSGLATQAIESASSIVVDWTNPSHQLGRYSYVAVDRRRLDIGTNTEVEPSELLKELGTNSTIIPSTFTDTDLVSCNDHEYTLRLVFVRKSFKQTIHSIKSSASYPRNLTKVVNTPVSFTASASANNTPTNCDSDIELSWFQDTDRHLCQSYWFDIDRYQLDIDGNKITTSKTTVVSKSAGVTKAATDQYNFKDTGSKVEGATYQYEIIAVTEWPNDKSTYSSSTVARTVGIGGTIDGSSSLVSATINPTTDLTISWNDLGNESGYKIIRKINGVFDQEFEVDQNDTSFTDGVSGNAARCIDYSYEVIGFNACVLDGISLGEVDKGIATSGGLVNLTFSADFSTTYNIGSLLIDKGYKRDFISLEWDIAQNQSNLTKQRIYRRLKTNLGDSILIATLDPGARSFTDNEAEANVLYDYYLTGEANCGAIGAKSNTIEAVGFRVPWGLVNGHVDFVGGVDVKGAQIAAENLGALALNQSVFFDGDRDVAVIFDKDVSPAIISSFPKTTLANLDFLEGNHVRTFEFWARPESYNGGSIFCTGTVDLNPNSYFGLEVPQDNKSNVWFVRFNQLDAVQVDLAGIVALGEWHHFAITHDSVNVRMYVDGNNFDTHGAPLTWKRKLNTAGKGVFLGGVHKVGTTFASHYHGYLDEFRVWSKAKTKEEIEFQRTGFLFGDESGLEIYLRADEKVGDFLYDASYENGDHYHRRHFSIARNVIGNNLAYSTTIPSSDQLGYNAITDAKGNYTIPYIRYRGAGELFNLVPFIFQHEFQPSNRNLFIGQSVPVHNQQDFEDISAFKVTGTVFYGRKEGNDTVRYCPAAGLFMAVDGTIALKGSLPVVTDNNGEFDLIVPIGKHDISIGTTGHTFITGRFPATGKHDFQEELSGIQFIDNTQTTIIGKVVGGTTEAAQPSGFGRNKNNIGVATLIFDGGCFVDTITTNLLTGEYTANVFPLEYVVSGGANVLDPEQFIASNPDVKFPNQIEDLTFLRPEITETDSVFDGAGELVEIKEVTYGLRKDFVYRVPHSLQVLMQNGQREFDTGESYVTVFNDGVEDIIDADQFDYPVFIQGEPYSARIKITEIYSNNDDINNIIYDTVGVTDAEVRIGNGISDQNTTFRLDNPSGDTLYSFFAGEPNILIDPNDATNAFLKKLEVSTAIGITSNRWVLDAYVLGNKQNGTGFITKGPDVVEHVLRDPPGSNSSATISKESQVTTSYTWDVVGNESTENNLFIKVGAELATGIGVAVFTDIKSTSQIGLSAEIAFGGGQDFTETVIFSENLSTSDDPNYVGADADLFIGKSMNVNLGVADYVQPIAVTDCGGEQPCNGLVATGASGQTYQIGRRASFTVSPDGYNTYFVYTQRHIREQLIPDLKRVRNQILLNSPFYTSNLSVDDPNFGKNNDDPVFGIDASTDTPLSREDADFDGVSYSFIKVFAADEIQIDSVRTYNEQIRLWEEALKNNEQMKVNAASAQSLPKAGSLGETIATGIETSTSLLVQETSLLNENVSFSSGSAFTRTVTLTNDVANRSSWEVNLSATFGIELEATVSGTGVGADHSITLGGTTSGSTTTGNTESITYEFNLQDDDLGNFFSVDILDGGNQHGPIFKTRGGSSSCPYEGAQRTNYYQPGTILSPATLQHERPSISIAPASQIGIPSDEAAVYGLTLGNNNTTFGAGVTYKLYLDPASNPKGAIVTIDGQNVDRNYSLSAGGILNRQLVVNKGPQQNEFNDLKLVFGSTCDVNISDDALFSAVFIPTCSNSSISTPLNQWTVNNSFNDTLPITIGDYDLNFEGLDKIAFRYKSSKSPTWVERETFFNRETAGGDTLLLSRTSPRTIYNWDISGLINGDGDYDLQTISYCLDKTTRESEIITGTIDRVNPVVFGKPSPIDGVLSPNDEISIRFNETIDAEKIVKNLSFDVRGVLNGTPIRHFTSLGFDGNDNLSIPNLNLGNEFTFEAWINREKSGKEEVLFSYGGIVIGVNVNDELFVSDGTITIKGKTAVVVDAWSHISMAYSKVAKQINVVLNGNTDVTASFDPVLTNSPVSVGNTFHGRIHELRVWTDARRLTEVRLSYLQTLSGNEIDLAGYWPLDEGTGNIAFDKTGRRPATVNAAWRFAQEARGIALNGVDDHFEIDGSTVGFGPEEDFTLSFWFNSTNGSEVALFSNGKVDGAEFDSQAWAVYSDVAGQLALHSNGKSYPIAGNYLDGKWHHFAFSVNRIGFVNLYMDGKTVVSVSAQNFSTFAGNKIYMGVYGRFEGTINSMDHYMAGIIDEVRL